MKIRNFIAKQWHDIKGNAKWDFIKWSIGGCILIPTIITALLKFICDSPLWVLLAAYFATLVILVGLFFGIYKLMGLFKPESYFEIEGQPCELETLKRYVCEVRIYNRNTEKTAQNVKIEILKIESSIERNKPYFEAKPPITLLPENESVSIFINPGAEKNFTLFEAQKIEGQSRNNLSEPMIPYCYVMSEFKNPKPVAVDHKKILFFEKNNSYRTKIRVTAHDFPPTEVEFNINFVGEGSQCRFTLVKA